MIAIDKQTSDDIDFDVFVNILEERFDFYQGMEIAVRSPGGIWRHYACTDVGGELEDVEQLMADGELVE